MKQLDRNGVQGNREFLAEVLMLSLVHHPNLVNLVGYCADGHQRILVYEYMSNGSLEDHLLGNALFALLLALLSNLLLITLPQIYLRIRRHWIGTEGWR